MFSKRENRNDKWSQPGWRIEQKYTNKVLIGNWLEEKLQFTRECRTASSTHRSDFRPQTDHRPDVVLRRDALRRAEGLPAKCLLSHHGIPTSHYLVTLYDETYGRRTSTPLPALRSWHPDKLAWVPERSDHPALTPPTNFGLDASRRLRLEQQRQPSPLPLPPAVSVYRSAYQRPPSGALLRQPRLAGVPRGLSSSLSAANRNNKDLDLKQRPCRVVPDGPPALLPPLLLLSPRV